MAENPDVRRDGGFTGEAHYNKYGKDEGREGYWNEVDPANTLNGSDVWEANVTLTPEQQRALDSQMRMQEGRSVIGESFMDRLSAATANPMNFGGLRPRGNQMDLSMFGFGGTPGTPASTRERQALSKGSDYSDADIQGYAKHQGWLNADGSLNGDKANDVYLHGRRMGVSGSQIDRAFKLAQGTSNNWTKSKGLSDLTSGSDITAQQIRDYVDKQGWVKDGVFDAKYGEDLYKAAQKFGVSGRQLDEAGSVIGWKPGTADKWVTDNPEQIAAVEGTKGPNAFNFNLEDFLGEQGTWRQRAQDNVTAFQNPLHEADRSRLETQLANMGHQRGSEAWNNEMRSLEDRIGRERLQGFSAGQAESALQFGQGLQSATFGNTANQNALSMGINAGNYNSQQRQQELAEMFAMRSQPLNEMNAFVSGQQVGMPQFPGFTGATGGQAANIGQAQQQLYSGQMDQFGIQQQQQSQQNQALGSAAAMAAMYAMYAYSDARLKKNIKFVGTIDGVNIYSFDYVWGEKSVGVLAQEVPWAAVVAPCGFLMVDYSKVW